MNLHQNYGEEIWQQAREYHRLLHSGMCAPEQKQQLKAWLSLDDKHIQCFRELEVMHRQMRYSSLGEEAYLKQRVKKPSPKKLRHSFSLIAACVALVAFLFVYQQSSYSPPLEFRTARGEIADFTLADGTKITLGAKSHVLVSQNERQRKVTQITGDAIYAVTKDPQRPFVVTVNDLEVTVLGTVFEVLKRNKSIKVEVAEGRVNVSNKAFEEELTASESVTVSNLGEFSDISTSQQTQFAGWRNKRFSFQKVTIAEIVGVLNRYRQDPIRLAHPQIGQQVITTSFRLNQLNQFLDALQVSHHIQWHIDSMGVIWLKN
ncbi:FecR domain-containing protein [Paraglaciecola aquimarina]|uniref:FecR domain-containing protein n=1 Tax=Paraglaciecola aquimarina TaxID=1235557 RepID=A0ABU3STY2_9ALTE|nr:FecR domain-containing protein [Paraglaciecola aquimarina]MDU0353474.1 FecR domain-containing protein [Paraglaciecola aquimarina]